MPNPNEIHTAAEVDNITAMKVHSNKLLSLATKSEQKSNFHADNMPAFPRVQPKLSLSLDGPFTGLSKQHPNDLHGSKTSSIHKYTTLEWGPFGTCSVTCGQGVRKRYRKCRPADCLGYGTETQVLPCSRSSCTGTLRLQATRYARTHGYLCCEQRHEPSCFRSVIRSFSL